MPEIVRVATDDATPEVLRGLANWMRVAARSGGKATLSKMTAFMVADVLVKHAAVIEKGGAK